MVVHRLINRAAARGAPRGITQAEFIAHQLKAEAGAKVQARRAAAARLRAAILAPRRYQPTA